MGERRFVYIFVYSFSYFLMWFIANETKIFILNNEWTDLGLALYYFKVSQSLVSDFFFFYNKSIKYLWNFLLKHSYEWRNYPVGQLTLHTSLLPKALCRCTVKHVKQKLWTFHCTLKNQGYFVFIFKALWVKKPVTMLSALISMPSFLQERWFMPVQIAHSAA